MIFHPLPSRARRFPHPAPGRPRRPFHSGSLPGAACWRVMGLLLLLLGGPQLLGADLRVGIIGMDTSHVPAFTQLLNDPKHKNHVPGARVVAGFKGGSPDLDSSWKRVDGYTQELVQKYGVKLYPSIELMCQDVDAVLLESVDGRPHLAQAIPVILARKPLFIDKPMAASLRDVTAIFRLAREHGVPVFSASSLRFGNGTMAVRRGSIGDVLQADTTSPCHLDPTHPDLFWYGIHGVESLFTVMGTGCESVRRGTTSSGAIEVTGTWQGGRTGTFREDKAYGGKARGTRGEAVVGAYDGYAPLVAEIVKFFQTGISPVHPEETIELFAFMEAADESKRRGGQPVQISEMLERAGHARSGAAELIDVRRIWDAGKHNAFTDLIRFKEAWFCVFREGEGHVSPDGAIRVLTSTDGKEWSSAALIKSPTSDLRDPKIVLNPQGKLMLVAAGAIRSATATRHQSYVWTSEDGRSWGEPTAVADPDVWLWRVAWNGPEGIGIGYDTLSNNFARLYHTKDGTHYTSLLPTLFEDGQPNETGIAFRPDGSAVALLRRDGNPGSGLLGTAPPPYKEWIWRDLKARIGGPQLVALPDGRLLGAVRLYDRKVRTSLVWVDLERPSLTEVLALPSGGDTSYPGLVLHGNEVWVSYYSSHEGKTAIYLARVKLHPRLTTWNRIEPLFRPPTHFPANTNLTSPLKRVDGSVVATPADWPARRQEILAEWHRVMGPWPPLLEQPRLEILRTEERRGILQHRVRIELAKDRFEEGWYLTPKGAGPFPAVLVPYYEAETSVGQRGYFRDYGLQLAVRGFATLSFGPPGGDASKPALGDATCQPLSFLAYVAANAHTALAGRPEIDKRRIGIVGHSFGGKWAMFAGCLDERFAAVAVSDPGVAWDETRLNVNYWAPWYLGAAPEAKRQSGVPSATYPRTGAYKALMESGRGLHELQALLAPRPFFVSGGAEDPPERWTALRHLADLNRFLGTPDRVGLSSRAKHDPNDFANDQVFDFFVHFLGQPRS